MTLNYNYINSFICFNSGYGELTVGFNVKKAGVFIKMSMYKNKTPK